MTTLQSFAVTGDTTAQAIANLAHAVGEAPTGAHFVCVFYDAEHEDDAIFDFLRARFERAAILGGTSCNGVMSQNGLAGSRSIGLLVLDDPLGNYGTAATQLHGDAADCAERTLHAALENADCAGELPELIWVYQTPGQEEAVIEGLRRVVGDRCPIIGGSSADNDVGGQWRQMGPDGVIHDGLVVGVLFSSGGIGFAFQGGYEPSGESGIVTRIGYDPVGDSGVVTQSCGRQIISIDGEPAAEVYNRWIGGALEDKLEGGGNILANTTMHTVGIDVGGTFTDLLAVDSTSGAVKLAKVSTTVDNQAIGFMAALQSAGDAVTDEASAMELAGYAPRLVPGGAQNFKVTYPDDFALAEAVLMQRRARHAIDSDKDCG